MAWSVPSTVERLVLVKVLPVILRPFLIIRKLHKLFNRVFVLSIRLLVILVNVIKRLAVAVEVHDYGLVNHYILLDRSFRSFRVQNLALLFYLALVMIPIKNLLLRASKSCILIILWTIDAIGFFKLTNLILLETLDHFLLLRCRITKEICIRDILRLRKARDQIFILNIS